MYGGVVGGAMDVLDELQARGFIKQCSDLDGLRAVSDWRDEVIAGRA